MKKTTLVLGAIFLLIGGIQTGKYILDYQILSTYGKGYLWGSGAVLVIGILLLYYSIRKKKAIRIDSKDQ